MIKPKKRKSRDNHYRAIANWTLFGSLQCLVAMDAYRHKRRDSLEEQLSSLFNLVINSALAPPLKSFAHNATSAAVSWLVKSPSPTTRHQGLTFALRIYSLFPARSPQSPHGDLSRRVGTRDDNWMQHKIPIATTSQILVRCRTRCRKSCSTKANTYLNIQIYPSAKSWSTS